MGGGQRFSVAQRGFGGVQGVVRRRGRLGRQDAEFGPATRSVAGSLFDSSFARDEASRRFGRVDEWLELRPGSDGKLGRGWHLAEPNRGAQLGFFLLRRRDGGGVGRRFFELAEFRLDFPRRVTRRVAWGQVAHERVSLEARNQERARFAKNVRFEFVKTGLGERVVVLFQVGEGLDVGLSRGWVEPVLAQEVRDSVGELAHDARRSLMRQEGWYLVVGKSVPRDSVASRILLLLGERYPVTLKEVAVALGLRESAARLEVKKLQAQALVIVEDLDGKVFVALSGEGFTYLGLSPKDAARLKARRLPPAPPRDDADPAFG